MLGDNGRSCRGLSGRRCRRSAPQWRKTQNAKPLNRRPGCRTKTTHRLRRRRWTAGHQWCRSGHPRPGSSLPGRDEQSLINRRTENGERRTEPTLAAGAEAACRLCPARRRKTSFARQHAARDTKLKTLSQKAFSVFRVPFSQKLRGKCLETTDGECTRTPILLRDTDIGLVCAQIVRERPGGHVSRRRPMPAALGRRGHGAAAFTGTITRGRVVACRGAKSSH